MASWISFHRPGFPNIRRAATQGLNEPMATIKSVLLGLRPSLARISCLVSRLLVCVCVQLQLRGIPTANTNDLPRTEDSLAKATVHNESQRSTI